MSVNYNIILNEHAGSGRSGQIWPQIKAELDAQHVAYSVISTDYPNHAMLLGEQLAKKTPDTANANTVALAIGGDGTLHEVLSGIKKVVRRYPIPVAYVPVGSGDDLARGIQMSLDWKKALTQILQCQRPHLYNIGTYDETIKHQRGIFTNNFGIGLDAAIITKANQSKTKVWLNQHHMGSLSYLASAIGVLYNQGGFNLMVHVNQQRDIYQKALLVTTTNHPYFGGGVQIAPPATMLDDQLHLVVIEKPNFFKLLWLVFLLATHKHLKSRFVHYYSAKKIHLIVNSIEFGQVDGEELGGRYYDLYMNVDQYPFWIDTSV
ncbi:diacylglycerol/lipid kinase family protein [Levilactobacillus bambusae]|uniref:Diacylglycerol kinase n=1 Tax=Levilactobacillus bambusae TaxID=2024736 RepID=A0A2V1N0B9_9LACO|nr:diacylglycerol kinase family protein [Levilactobacillus bambusae]PWG00664.1 diacylglycerol kinase [Levilactobacillus bambusae]